MAVPQYVTDLRTRRDAITEELADIDNNTTRLNPGSGPDPNGEGGGVNMEAYKAGLYAELREIQALLKDAAIVEQAEQSVGESLYVIESQVE